MSAIASGQEEASFFYKSRPIWQPDAYRLLRENTSVRFARKVVPPVVDGFRIVFPETTITLGLRINVASRRIPGQPLIDLLYEAGAQALALEAGLAVLTALHSAAVQGRPFPLFSLVYRLGKGPRILLKERRAKPPLLSRAERHELSRLVWRYVAIPEPHRVLVHGDLQPTHLICDPATSTVGMIDLEALHVGKPAANFGQLFTGYHHADPALGRSLYRRYRQRFPHLFDRRFDDDLRTAVALRSYRHVEAALRGGNATLTVKARSLLASVLAGRSFAELCQDERDW